MGLLDQLASTLGAEFRPGQQVPESGIYTVLHDPDHPAEHEITCVRGEPFPPCRCAHPRYKVKWKAKHISELPHFRNP
jgi:hypothetical protein